MAFQKDFGRQLQILRKQRGMSQERLALASHIDRSYIGQIERGEVNPTLRIMRQLAKALQVRVSDLLIWIGGNPSGERARRNLIVLRDRLRALTERVDEKTHDVHITVDELKALKKRAEQALEQLSIALGPIQEERSQLIEGEGDEKPAVGK